MPVPPYRTTGFTQIQQVTEEGRRFLLATWNSLSAAWQRDIGKEAASKTGFVGWGTPDAVLPPEFGGFVYDLSVDLFNNGTRVKALYVRPIAEDLTYWVAVPVPPGTMPFRVQTTSGVVECANGMAALACSRYWSGIQSGDDK